MRAADDDEHSSTKVERDEGARDCTVWLGLTPPHHELVGAQQAICNPHSRSFAQRLSFLTSHPAKQGVVYRDAGVNGEEKEMECNL